MKERAEEFTGRTSAMRTENRWLGAEDIFGAGDITVTIAAVIRYTDITFEGGRTKKELFALRFEGKTKQMILSPTKRRPIVKAFGTDVREWIGKRITLYVNTDVPKPGSPDERTWGIRVREIDQVQQPSQTPADPEPAPAAQPPAKLEEWLAAEAGFPQLDPIIAILEALHILYECSKMMHRSANGLMDASIGDVRLDKVRTVVARDPNVKLIRDVRGKHSGRGINLDIEVLLDGQLKIDQCNTTVKAIEDALRSDMVGVHDVNIHYHPCPDGAAEAAR